MHRIGALNTEGPGLNAVRALNRDAVADARALDRERRRGQVRGPLHGIPVLVKDNVDVHGMPTTAGSVALERSRPRADAAIVARLRRAGAVILGKTNLSEFAYFTTSGSPSGYSSLGGQVLNAYDTDLGPSGSSSGSASAAAAGLAALTIGTETSGSIISPSAAQGIVGMRPTLGLVSRTGILPIAASQDTAGPMTRTVADAAAELQAIAGKDPEDPATADQPPVPDYAAALDPGALDGARLGVVANNDPNYQAALAVVRTLGAETVEITAPANTTAPSILNYEFKRDLNAYLERLGPRAPRRSLAEIVAYNERHPEEALKFGQTLLTASEAIDLADPATRATYEANRDRGRAEARASLEAALTRGTADSADDLAAILTPSGTLTGVGARAGHPALTVPAGYTSTQRRPVNVTFTGARYSEATLLAFGHAYERASQLREPPSLINPALYRCADTVPPSVFGKHSCAPGRELLRKAGRVRLGFSLETTSIDDLQRRMSARRLSATELTRAYLARIAHTNTSGPAINAVRIVNPDALADARAADRERRRGRVRGPLHGIPVLVKDNIDVDGLPTTAGAVALERSFPRGDSPVAANLRRAGAIILGKTNLSEFANFYSGNSISGYSGLGGQVLTPIDLDVNPSGSSSGSGAAASAGLAAATIGTETSGSIISPSARHGIVGMRPTVGLVSSTGIIPISATQDTAGPMTQTVVRRGRGAGGDRRRRRLRRGPPPQRAAGPPDRRDREHRQRLPGGGRRGRRAGRRDRDGHAARQRERARHPQLRVQARPQPLPRAAAALGPDRHARRRDRVQPRQSRRGDQARHEHARGERGDRPRGPRDQGRLRGQPRRRARPGARQHRRGADARDRRHGRRPGGDPDAVGHADRRRGAGGLPGPDDPGRLRGGHAQPGQRHVHRRQPQRGDAAGGRLRVRAGHAGAPRSERDQPGVVALRAGQRVRAALLRAIGVR